MRLLVVSTWFPWPPDNGARLRAFNLVRELARSHRISLLSFGDGGPVDPGRVAPLEEFCDSVEVVPRDAFHHGGLTRSGLLSSVPRAYVQGFSPEMMANIRRAIPRHDAAIALMVTAALYFRAVTALPVVFEEAEVAVIRDRFRAARGPAQRMRQGLTWWKYSRFVRGLCRHAAMTTVVSENEGALLGGIGCDLASVAVVPNGVDALDLEWPRPSRPANRLVYPGSVTFSANLDAVSWFLEAVLPLIHAKRPDVEFWVTGKTEGARVPSAGPASRLTMTGPLPDVRPAIAESAVCVVPLRIGGGTRIKILQAMAVGTPVVATSKGAEGLGVTPGRDILIGDTPAAFAGHVLALLSSPGLRDSMAAEARTLVRDRYTWTQSGAKLNEVVQRAHSAWKAVHS